MKAALPFLANPESTILILGTMPGEESLRLQQYYGNKGNQFWKLLFTLFDEPFTTDYAIRKALLVKHHIAVWDVLATCEREGSLDSRIRNEVANDFKHFYESHPGIRFVFFSSKAAAQYYDKYAERKKGVSYSILPSPSGANAGMTFLQKLERWKVILQFLS